jgi:hypothetical protein
MNEGNYAMNIVKKSELKTKKDLYLLLTTGDFIVTNDDYTGLQLLDISLVVVKKIPLLDSLCIYDVYKHFSNNELLLYCPDNACMAWVDISTSTHKVFPMSQAISEHIFSPAYCWDDNYAIFTSHDYQCYMLNIQTGLFHAIDRTTVKDKCPQLAILMETKIQASSASFELRNGYIVDNHQDGSPLTIITANTTLSNIMPPPAFSYHNVIYAHELVVFIGETNIQLVSKTGKTATLEPAVGYHFLKAEVIANENGLSLAVLSGGTKKQKESMITIYIIYSVTG